VRYHVTIAGKTVPVDIDGQRVVVDGREYHATLRSVPGTPLRQLVLDGRPATLALERLDRGRWLLVSAGERWDAEVLDDRALHIRSLAGGGNQRPRASVLLAPMPGLVVRIHTQPGDRIEAGTGLVVLEAMKMENELKAAAPGVVKSIRVAPGEAVEKGQVLVEFGEP
jgi:acetyl/propionyl-CoA carboxylase alpha subunit